MPYQKNLKLTDNPEVPMENSTTKTNLRRVLVLSLGATTMALLMLWGISIYLTPEASLSVTLFATAYALWWCITVPPYYQKLPGIKTHAWANETSQGLILAVPFLGVPISLVLTLLGSTAIRYLTGISTPFWEQWVLSLLALPFSTAAAIAYISYELHKLAD